MGRWQPDARGRLQQAALELYRERGFDQTTAAEIAERAGLTERTFFRYFADKREVLFAGSTTLQDTLVTALREAPTSATPLDQVAAAVDAAGTFFTDRDFSRLRQSVITANAELRERELIKMASLASAFADELRRRGIKEPGASLTAEAGVAIFKVAFQRWIDAKSSRRFSDFVQESLLELKAVTSNVPVR
jgi:AcrR family transcriptional regulator